MKKLLYSIVAGFILIAGTYGTAEALATYQVVQGGTGSTTLTGILKGNGTSQVGSLIVGSGLSFDGTTLTASGGGGSGNVATSSAETSTYVPFWTSTGATPATLSGGESTFTYNSALNKLTIESASTTNLTIGALSGLLKQAGGFVTTAVADTDYQVPLTFGDGLTRTANDVDCDTASGSVFGCLASADWTTFNSKESALTFNYPLTRSVNAISLAFGTTTSNLWAGTQTFTNAPTFSSMTLGSVLFAGTAGALTQDNANFFFDNTQNNLGLGQIVPWTQLEITATTTAGTTTATGYGVSSSQIRLGSVAEAITVNELLGGIDFVSNDTSLTGGRLVTASIQSTAAGTHTGVSVPSDLVFFTSPASSVPTEKLRITNTGIGVGTSSPYGRFAITSNGTGADTRAFTVANVNNVAVFNINDTGETGIGTTTDLASNFAFGVQLSDSATGAGDNTARFIHGDAGQTGTGVVIGSVRAASSAYKFLELVSDYDGTPLEQFTFRGDGRLGIGTSTPVSLLNVAGVTAPSITISDTDATANLKHWFVESSSGTFRIGTTSDDLVKTSSAPLSISSTGVVTVGSPPGTTAQLVVQGGASGTDIIQLQRTIGTTLTYGWNLAGGVLSFIDRTASKNTLQTGWLSSSAQVIAGFDYSSGGGFSADPGVFRAGNGSGGSTDTIGGQLTISTGVGTGAGTAQDILFRTATETVSGTTVQSLSTRLTIDGTTGNIGIATTTPAWRLQVASSTAPQIALSDASLTSNIWTQRSIAGAFYLATASPSTYATSTVSALSIDVNGIVTMVKGVFTDLLRIPYSATLSLIANGDIGIDSTSNQFQFFSGGSVKVLGNGNLYPAFTYATTTAWTGTTTIPLGTAYVGETWNGVQCFTDVGTLGVSFYDGTNRMDYVPTASTTVNTNALTTNNTFTATEKRYVDVGTPASAPTKISCTVSKSITAD